MTNLTHLAASSGLALFLLAPLTSAGDGTESLPCSPSWVPTFGTDLNSFVNALVTYDDGTGEALFVGGFFTSAGTSGAARLARWDGSSWSALGTGVDGSAIYSLGTYDDGTGPRLIASGDFTTAGSLPASRIAQWDGQSWSRLGSGLNFSAHAFATYDDGTGEALYAGGSFSLAGGVSANHIAKWDGQGWSPVGAGLDGPVFALTTFDDGTGEALYAGGLFSNAGVVPIDNVAKWDGQNWHALGSGTDDVVLALEPFDDGAAYSLYVGGEFSFAGGAPATNVAQWNGQAWSSLGAGVDSDVRSLLAFDFNDGSGPVLLAGGDIGTIGGAPANSIGRWNGTSWSSLRGGVDGVEALAAFDDWSGNAVFAGGIIAFPPADNGDTHLTKYGCPFPTGAYCTAKPSSAGCLASISTTAPQSQPVSGANDYSVVGWQVQELKTGILFGGIVGPANLPFAGGTGILCVQPPLVRGTILSSGGSDPDGCAGQLRTLVNDGAVIPGGLDAGPGGSAWYQYWYRDPQNGAGNAGTSLSNAIRLDFL